MSSMDQPADQESAVLGLMARHRSVRAYLPRPVPDEAVRRAIASAQQAATSSWIQGYHLYEVSQGPVRERLSELAGNQAQVREAPRFFVICGETRRHRLAAKLADAPHVECTETFLLSVIDASLFTQNLVLALEAQGLGTCYIGGLRNDLAGVDSALSLPEGTFPLFGLCAGWPAEDPGPRPRLAPEDIWSVDRVPTEAEASETIERFDAVAADYYARRGAPGRNWSGGLWRKFKTALRPSLKGFYESKGARFE
ncbi:MAG: nitroreductase family protein [Planctomycetota bacterium]